MFRPLFASLPLATSALAGDLPLVCGGDEVFQTHPAAKLTFKGETPYKARWLANAR
jgi:hypothetical protein